MKYAFIERHRHAWPVSVQCRVLQVSAAGYHAHLVRRASDAQRQRLSDEALLVHKRFMKSYSVIDQQKSNVYFSPKPVSISSTSASRVCASRDLNAIHSYFILCQSFSMRFSSGL